MKYLRSLILSPVCSDMKSKTTGQEEGDPLAFLALTPKEEAGIGVFHVFGTRAEDAVKDLFEPIGGKQKLEPGRLYFGHLKKDDRTIDEAIVRVLPPDENRAGRRIYEINIHSGPAVLEKISSVLREKGGKKVKRSEYLSQWGETGSFRPLQVAAWQEMMDVGTRRGAAAMHHQIHDGFCSLLLSIENHGSGKPANDAAAPPTELEKIRMALRLRATGMAITNPPLILITGPPNAGKSTLVNALSGKERSIVHKEPGTTRDVVEAEAFMKGYHVRLEDTAGLRTTRERIEEEGIRRARNRFDEADLIVWITDVTEPAVEPEELPSDIPSLLVGNKMDLLGEEAEEPEETDLLISAREETNLDGLKETILNLLQLEQPLPVNKVLPFYAEQIPVLERMEEAITSNRSEEAADLATRLLEQKHNTE